MKVPSSAAPLWTALRYGISRTCNDSGAVPMHAGHLHADEGAAAGLLQKAANQDERQQQPRLEVTLMAQQSPDQREQVLLPSQQHKRPLVEIAASHAIAAAACTLPCPIWCDHRVACRACTPVVPPSERANKACRAISSRALPIFELHASHSSATRPALHSPPQMSACMHGLTAHLHGQSPQCWLQGACMLKALLLGRCGSSSPGL